MKFNIFLLLLFLSLSCSKIKPTIDAGFETDATRRNKLDKYFSALTEMDQFNGVVLVKDDNSKTYLKAFNLNKDAKSNTYVTIKSQFDVHSVSKLIAKAIIIKMEKDGIISRKDTLKKYISDFPRGDEITIQHLLDNTSGLPREPNLIDKTKNELSNEEIIAWAKKETLEFKPGSDKRYSNVGYELLYYIIGKLNNTTFSNYVKNSLFKNLKMTNSGAHFYVEKNNLKNWAKNHQLDNEILAVDNITADDYKQSMLYSTAEDLYLFLSLTSQEPYKSLLKNQKDIISWTGGSDGIRAHVQYNTIKNYSFVVLANYDEIPLTKILEDIPKIIEDKPFEMPIAINRVAVKVSEEILKKYTGTYDFIEADHMLLDFKLENNTLAVYQKGEKLVELFAENETVFFADPTSAESFEFKKNKEFYSVIMGWKGVKLKGVKKD